MRIDKTNQAQPSLGLFHNQAPAPDIRTGASALMSAATNLLTCLESAERFEASVLRRVMTNAYGRSDTDGAWAWMNAYEASEAALILFLRKNLPAMRIHATSPAAVLPMLANIAAWPLSKKPRGPRARQAQKIGTRRARRTHRCGDGLASRACARGRRRRRERRCRSGGIAA